MTEVKQEQNISQKFRHKYGLSQAELAKLCNKSRSSIMNWEYNKGCPVSTQYILQTILDQGLDAKQMVDKLKQIFDKPEDVTSF